MALNRGFTYETTVGPQDEGLALAAHLASRHGHSSEAEWRARIAEGRVLVDGAPVPPDKRLTRGQVIAWMRPPWEEPEAPLAFAVLLEDEDVVAVAKPSGLSTNPGGGFLEHTLLHLVRRRYPGASPAHRLGRGTSGLVLFGRTDAANRALSEALRERQAVKVYRALVEGHPAQDAFTVEAPIGPVPYGALGSVHAASPQGKAARSHVEVLERRGAASLVEVRIETGRPHQIRIHMAACGHPLAGDPLYGPGGVPKAGGRAVPGDLGYLLHAYRLAFPHPRTGARVDLRCQPPPVLRSFGNHEL